MAASLLKRAGIGFLLGIAVSVILRWLGMPGQRGGPLLQTVVSGIYGAMCMGGTILYEIDAWPLMRSTVLHWLITALPYGPIALLLGWVAGPKALLVSEGIMLAIFLLIWLIMFLRYKARIRKLNRIVQQHRERNEEHMIGGTL